MVTKEVQWKSDSNKMSSSSILSLILAISVIFATSINITIASYVAPIRNRSVPNHSPIKSERKQPNSQFVFLRATSSNDDAPILNVPNNFNLQPGSSDAQHVTSRIGLTSSQHDKLSQLASLIVSWNKNINLISRKDCNEGVVFGRHIVPSLALSLLPSNPFSRPATKVMDVGTGGGFPGLPLAILFPETDFLLVDSVGKKVGVVSDIAQELGLENVHTYNGRVEEMVGLDSAHKGGYDVCIGRSVAALPKFCFWVTDLLKKGEGKIVYIIGGDVEPDVLSKCEVDVSIDDLLCVKGSSDKNALVFDDAAVSLIAGESGEKKKNVKPASIKKKNPRKKNKKPKGEWSRGEDSKQRGYDNFQRFEA